MAGRVSCVYAYLLTLTLSPDFNSTVQWSSHIVICLSQRFTRASSNTVLEVLKKVSDIQLTKSKLMLIKNLIGNLERLGIVHILVNDETIKSWVDPYEE